MKRNLSSSSKMMRFVKTIERVGNRIPHPVYMFLILWVGILVISAACEAAGLSVTYTVVSGTGEAVEKTVSAANMLSKSSLQGVLASMISNFSTNSAVPPIIVLSMFMMVADESGFFSAGLRRLLVNAPAFLTTFLLSVVCICMNICSTGGYVLAVALGSIVYRAKGRNPIAGVMVAWASSAAGYTANLLPATADVTLAEITNTYSQPYGQSVHVLSHWYFMIISTFVLGFVTALIAESFLTKLYPDSEEWSQQKGRGVELTADEQRGLKWAGIGALITTIVFLILVIPKNAFFRSEDGTLVPDSPLMDSILIVISVYFLIVGLCFGYGSKTFKNKDDLPRALGKGISSVSGMLVMFFFASQFTYAFTKSGLGTIIAVKGERLLESINLNGLPLLILFILLCTLINLFMPSASTKYAILAAVFVPMFTGLGIHPTYTALAYRIGDTMTNNITPLSVGIPCAIAKVQEFQKGKNAGSGIGTIISTQFPFSLAYFLTLAAMLAVFYLFRIPLGPGGLN